MLKEDLIVLTITEGQTGMDISYLPGQRKALGLLSFCVGLVKWTQTHFAYSGRAR